MSRLSYNTNHYHGWLGESQYTGIRYWFINDFPYFKIFRTASNTKPTTKISKEAGVSRENSKGADWLIPESYGNGNP